jgi:hypothetical protein
MNKFCYFIVGLMYYSTVVTLIVIRDAINMYVLTAALALFGFAQCYLSASIWDISVMTTIRCWLLTSIIGPLTINLIAVYGNAWSFNEAQIDAIPYYIIPLCGYISVSILMLTKIFEYNLPKKIEELEDGVCSVDNDVDNDVHTNTNKPHLVNSPSLINSPPYRHSNSINILNMPEDDKNLHPMFKDQIYPPLGTVEMGAGLVEFTPVLNLQYPQLSPNFNQHYYAATNYV